MTAAAFVPLSFAPGEAYQFDWSHEVVVLDGATVTVKVAHVRLCHSRMLFVRAYPRETQEMVFDAHDRAFAFFKGACTRGIYDNMKTAVDTIFVGKERALQPALPANVRALSGRSRRLHAGVGLGEGSGREPGRPGARALLHAAPEVQELRRAERLAAGSAASPTPRRIRIPRSPTRRSGRFSRQSGPSLCPMPAASMASTPCRRRSPRPAWCASTTTNTRSRRAPSAGRSISTPMPTASSSARTARSSASIRARFGRGETDLRPLALCAGAGAKAGRFAQRRAVQGLAAARRDGAYPAQARRH